jgi:hypothetical protein
MNRAAQSLGRLGGRKTSEVKAAAARANGKRGGRPKKKTTYVVPTAALANLVEFRSKRTEER